jgi:hypothetical protein
MNRTESTATSGRPSFSLTDLPQRLAARIIIDPVTGCWLWQGPDAGHGYCQVHWEGKRRVVHRVIYELLVGPIPPRLVLDHVTARGCRSRACCWPPHLEPITQQENVRRAYLPRRLATHCIHGHEWTPENTYYPPGRTSRVCWKCLLISARDSKRRTRAARRSEVES